ncbi:MAG: hypothetical protein J7598_03505 [Mitsuaria chitosanitabida]|uniref:hypothetical protein n=1 Tax=Roseateles chitosanitabidus TaxID=65048 RepID=UPI001B2C2340|nr:hypothetical protein [Roseateles chitosanitabidus]MBO9685656.1 hypothetical protein [Roseateles chitosanitabidus]
MQEGAQALSSSACRTDEHETLANSCLVEIDGLVEILRVQLAVHVGAGATGSALDTMLRRVQRLSELACICWDEDPLGNWDMGLDALRTEIHGAPTRTWTMGEA